MALCGQKGSNQKAANTEAENNPCSSAVRYWQYFIKTLQGAKGVKCIDAGKEQKDSSAGALYLGQLSSFTSNGRLKFTIGKDIGRDAFEISQNCQASAA